MYVFVSADTARLVEGSDSLDTGERSGGECGREDVREVVEDPTTFQSRLDRVQGDQRR